jgi:hypothetical protein
MDQASVEPNHSDVAGDALLSAVKEYCSCLRAIADEAECGRTASPEQIERAEASRLHLENAWTLFELHSCRDASAAPLRPRLQ